ncbi:MAG: site-specific DNA-methyltransferase [Saprospiraceae bacterium]|nr:site-specific DNA-methyltransferase [Saprospiraceae bacterium]
MAKKVESIKHTGNTRPHIPSKEEAGYEDANAKVQDGKKVLELPKNPVVHRGQDPELFWLNKYGNDDRDDLLRVDIRSLYRHEHIAPETLIKNLYKTVQTQHAASQQLDLFSVNELFGNALEKDELEKVSEYYHHQDGWTNRLIQGDSHLVMASLLEREGMAGQVQMIYFDPPYGIKYGGNWQIKLNNRDVKDGNDEALTGEPEQIKAFRDTWELGIHSYLSYLRDRLLIAKELLTESGSCFVQIGDENVHLVRSVMDEVFGSENFVSLITYASTSGLTSKYISRNGDYIIWYANNYERLKYRQVFLEKSSLFEDENSRYDQIELLDGTRRSLTIDEKKGILPIPEKSKIFSLGAIDSQGSLGDTPFEFNGNEYTPPKGRHWTANYPKGMERLKNLNRLAIMGKRLRYVRYFNDFPYQPITNSWLEIGGAVQSRSDGKVYVVQTGTSIVQRCLLMTTDPGDLVLDPTCGSGTTAFVAEQWGRRWITIDTSRIALNIAKQRLMTAVFPYYNLYDEQGSDIRQGFKYKTVPHITLKSLANDEPPATETLYDQPEIDKKLLRVSGPFTVETLQNFDPISPEALDDEVRVNEAEGAFEEVIKQHLLSAGIKNGRKDEMVVFRSVELLAGEALHAEGFYVTEKGEEKAYFHIGPKFGTVSKKLVSDAIKECRQKGDANWLIILGFSFESDIEGGSHTTSMGNFEVTKVRIHDDLLQEGLKKKPAKSAASFVTIGEPDISLRSLSGAEGKQVEIEIKGLDIYDPIKDEVKPRNVHDIAYWMVDDDYDGSNFVVKQVFFCGGDKDAFAKWRKGLDSLAKDSTKKKVEKTLKIEIDDEAFDRLYGHISHPIEVKKKGQKIAVRIVSQFGEESMKVLTAE